MINERNDRLVVGFECTRHEGCCICRLGILIPGIDARELSAVDIVVVVAVGDRVGPRHVRYGARICPEVSGNVSNTTSGIGGCRIAPLTDGFRRPGWIRFPVIIPDNRHRTSIIITAIVRWKWHTCARVQRIVVDHANGGIHTTVVGSGPLRPNTNRGLRHPRRAGCAIPVTWIGQFACCVKCLRVVFRRSLR